MIDCGQATDGWSGRVSAGDGPLHIHNASDQQQVAAPTQSTLLYSTKLGSSEIK